MKNRNIFIVLFILLIVFGIIIIINREKIFNNLKNNNSENNNGEYLIFNDDVYTYIDGKWLKYSKEDINNIQFYVYVNEEYIGKYYLEYVESWNILDKDKKFINYEGDIIAFSSNINCSIEKINTSNITQTEISYINDNYGIRNYDYLINDEVLSYDLNNDGKSDKLVIVSNIEIGILEGVYYNLIYADINNKNFTLVDNEISDGDLIDNNYYEFAGIINIKNEKYIAIKNNINPVGEAMEVEYNLYKFDSDGYKLLMEE